jgi:hypothetical protein
VKKSLARRFLPPPPVDSWAFPRRFLARKGPKMAVFDVKPLPERSKTTVESFFLGSKRTIVEQSSLNRETTRLSCFQLSNLARQPLKVPNFSSTSYFTNIAE